MRVISSIPREDEAHYAEAVEFCQFLIELAPSDPDPIGKVIKWKWVVIGCQFPPRRDIVCQVAALACSITNLHG